MNMAEHECILPSHDKNSIVGAWLIRPYKSWDPVPHVLRYLFLFGIPYNYYLHYYSIMY